MLDPRSYCFDCMKPLPSPDGICPACGKNNSVRRNSNGELPPANLANKFFIGRALGRGGFGITYVGMHCNLGTRVAVKEYFPADISRRAADGIRIEASSPEYTEMFEQGKRKALAEARIIARVQNVPDVVRIYDCFSRNNTVYIIMEYVEGETFADLVSRMGPLRWGEVWPVMRPMGAALDALHGQNLVHRDISPDNIMIRKDNGRAVLLDFGAASATIREGQEREKVLKEGYAAPEQYQDQAGIDGRADIYSWAATLYFTLTGERPPAASQRRFGDGELPWKRKKGDISRAVRDALARGMAITKEERYSTAGELTAALDSARERKSPWRAAGIAAAVLAGLVCLAAVGIGLFA